MRCAAVQQEASDCVRVALGNAAIIEAGECTECMPDQERRHARAVFTAHLGDWGDCLGVLEDGNALTVAKAGYLYVKLSKSNLEILL